MATRKSGLTKVDNTRKTTVDTKGAAELLAMLAIGHMRERTQRGLDDSDRAFVGYSDRYRETRERTGRRTDLVDLTMSGGLLTKGLAILERKRAAAAYEIVIGVGTGTSPVVKPPPYSAAMLRRRRKARRERVARPQPKPRGRRTGERSAPHNVMGEAHQRGLGRLPVRRWFGVSPSGRRMLEDALRRAASSLIRTTQEWTG